MDAKDLSDDPIAELITSYLELNGCTVDEFMCEVDTSKAGVGGTGEPSPLEFMRYVARNRPFVVRDGASTWPAVRTWSVPFLRASMGEHKVNVAVTPNGRADAPTAVDSGLVFAMPLEEDQPFSAFLDHVTRHEHDELGDGAAVRYAQTQNDNLRHEYAALAGDVQPDIPFARIALQRPPEATNLWLGNRHTVTALHRDHYENVYVQIMGCKHFVLLPPVCQPCVADTPLQRCTYERMGGSDTHPLLRLVPTTSDITPFPTWDPDRPTERATAYSHLAQPMRVTLRPGDMLYLPAMWYHKVSQSASEHGVCVAVNYWYDMDFTGPLYSLAAFVEKVHARQT